MCIDNNFLNDSRYLGDLAADGLVEEIFLRGEQALLFSLLKVDKPTFGTDSESSVQKFIANIRTKPSWADMKSVSH